MCHLKVDPVEKIMSQFSEDAVYEDTFRCGSWVKSWPYKWRPHLDVLMHSAWLPFLTCLLLLLFMCMHACQDLTREDPAFVGFEAIKRRGKMQQIPDALSAVEILCSMICKFVLLLLVIGSGPRGQVSRGD